MQMTNHQDSRASHRGLGLLAAFCFVIQQFLLPLHLALDEHSFLETSGDRLVSAGDHGHAHGHGHHDHDAPSEEEEPGHEPHPADEHYEEASDPVLRSSLERSVIAASTSRSAVEVAPLEPRGVAVGVVRSPRAPPQGLGSPPRAPPVFI